MACFFFFFNHRGFSLLAYRKPLQQFQQVLGKTNWGCDQSIRSYYHFCGPPLPYGAFLPGAQPRITCAPMTTNYVPSSKDDGVLGCRRTRLLTLVHLWMRSTWKDVWSRHRKCLYSTQCFTQVAQNHLTVARKQNKHLHIFRLIFGAHKTKLTNTHMKQIHLPFWWFRLKKEFCIACPHDLTMCGNS